MLIILFFYYMLSSSGHLQATFSSGEKGDWTVIWSSQENQCDVYGKCGPFGSCNPRAYAICTCLPGFKPRDQEEWNQGNWTGGCIRKELLQCQRNESASREDNQYGFANLTYMKIPDFAEPIAINTEEECREHCLDNCSCTAYAFYIGIGCMQWSGILIDSGQLPFDGTNSYIWVAYSEHSKTISCSFSSCFFITLLFIVMLVQITYIMV